MNCTDARGLIAAYTDGETSAPRTLALSGHLAHCGGCAGRQHELAALRGRIRREVPRHAAPQALRANVFALLDAARVARRPPPRVWMDRWRWMAGGAVSGCAATVLAWVIGTTVIDLRINEDLANDAVTSHVRATLGDQLIQVASSNQHTVKPWLSARLDYSPPVPDMQRDGFTLVGGRIDYLDQRPCATLVYKIREHSIDVFVRPGAGRTLLSTPRTVRGINVAHAMGSGMDWVAVSDVSPHVLTSFIERLSRAEDGSR